MPILKPKIITNSHRFIGHAAIKVTISKDTKCDDSDDDDDFLVMTMMTPSNAFKARLTGLLLDWNDIDSISGIPIGTFRVFVYSVFSRNDHKEIVEILIKEKAKIDALAANKYTPLHLACRNGHKEVVKIIIREKANMGLFI